MRVACGRTRGVKARERRGWTPYRGRWGLGGARGLRSWAREFEPGAAACGARGFDRLFARAYSGARL